MIENNQRKTGFLYQFNGSEERAPRESWHRTLAGAQRAQADNGGRGCVYRLISEDQSEKIC